MANADSTGCVGAMATPVLASPTNSARRGSGTANFVATCPVCGQPRVQYAYTQRSLIRLLQKGQVVDAYCGTCDVVWHASAQERAGYWSRCD
jgi:hypothetical protein